MMRIIARGSRFSRRTNNLLRNTTSSTRIRILGTRLLSSTPSLTTKGKKRTIRWLSSATGSNSDHEYVKIGNVQLPINSTAGIDRPDLLAKGYLSSLLGSNGESISSGDYDDLNINSLPPSILSHLQWMMKKDLLCQDVMLVGGSGSGSSTLLRRQLAMSYAELIQKPIHVVTITSDITESDLKQRRELVVATADDNNNNNNNSALELKFQNSAPVEAALNGHLLLLDGIEKASRNVLPTLNNLLEHRSMNLEDGTFLISHQRYEELQLQQQQRGINVKTNADDDGSVTANRMLPVHPDFRVIATAVPVGIGSGGMSGVIGRSLDPPLRSRFQIRRVEQHVQDTMLYTGGGDMSRNNKFLGWATAMEYAAESAQQESSGGVAAVWPFPSHQLSSAIETIRQFNLSTEEAKRVFLQYYPIANQTLFKNQQQQQYEASQTAFDAAWEEMVAVDNGSSSSSSSTKSVSLESIERDPNNSNRATVTFLAPSADNMGSSASNWLSSFSKSSSVADCGNKDSNKAIVKLSAPCGSGNFMPSSSSNTEPLPSRFHLTEGLQSVTVSMLQSHAVGNNHDMLLVGPTGEGKSAAASYYCAILGYKMHLIHAYPEMTFQDLFLRRITNENTGETSWCGSCLIDAITQGDVCVLDHAHKLRPDVLAGLQSLCLQRDVCLPDGRRILSQEKARQLFGGFPFVDDNVIVVHPSFRLIALASTGDNDSSSLSSTSWLTQDVMSMFSTIVIPTPTEACLRQILKSANPGCLKENLDKLLNLRSQLTPDVASDCGVSPLSTRNLLRIVRRLRCDSGDKSSLLHTAICEVLVADLLPPTHRAALESLLKRVGIPSDDYLPKKKKKKHTVDNSDMSIVLMEDTVSIGDDFSMPRKRVEHAEMVPKPRFFDIPSHVLTIKDLLQDWSGGERAFLLLGNQGVGKNMVLDRLCEVANFEREYIQLHRDSTIGQLTLQPTLEGGKVLWKDSPLVRAVSRGLSLVVDEADKAPTEVLAVLKGLVEDGELLLGDGRRISRHNDESNEPNIIPVHPDFTLWVLANRPGFPFLGNAFFKQIGDCFSTRVIANPDLQSEINLLSSYGRSVDPKLLRKIAASFAELRSLSDHGEITYPYSTRESVAVVKHLEQFPEDGIVGALHNVIDFDSFDNETYGMLGSVFKNHGIPVQDLKTWQEATIRQGRNLKIEFSKGGRAGDGSSNSPPDLSGPKEGKWDENNDPHIGGNQWAGGTGGSDTAGLGGRGGPYRLDRGHRVHQVSDEAKAQVSVEAAKAARAMAQRALEERLSEIDMSENEWDMYKNFRDPIRKDVANLRAILSQVDVEQAEEGWIKRQSHGELDEGRLVDGVTGERHIYKRRGISEDVGPSQQPKKLSFVVDVSGSMYRFNGYDGRLIRCLEVTNLIMESFEGMSQRFDYSIVGHSGDSCCIPFVPFGQPPANEKQKMKVLQSMIAHSQYCQAGDHTLEAIQQAIKDVVPVDRNSGESRDDSLVVAISDANLERYGIQPRELGRIMESGLPMGVKSHSIFIASFGREAEFIKSELPVGRGHVCPETSDLPRVVRNILATQV